MRVEDEIRERVEGKLGSKEVGLEIERRIEEGRKKLFDDAKAQLEREKEAALAEARQKELGRRGKSLIRCWKRIVEEAQTRDALELQQKEEERLRELELIQRQKEEAARRRKIEEEEEHLNQTTLLGKNKSRAN
ncbi:uncharacterized protein [Primulina huaijiensis]|uniref:uncharacterized protein n=1 Tax=Primulina huaijiensis TaxID=1492673 RepID=UPI003CC773ED